MTEVLIKRLSKNIELPKYETNGSSGMDLSANIEKQIKIEPGKTSIIPTGISVSMPKDFEIQIRSRSGLAAKSQISVLNSCLLYTSPSPRDRQKCRMPSSA